MIEAELLAEIQRRALAEVGWDGIEHWNLWVQRDVLPRGHLIQAQHQEIRLDRDSVMVFVDEEPRMNWGHRCHYLLFQPSGADLYERVPAAFPPYMLELPDSYVPFHRPVLVQPEWPEPRPPLRRRVKRPKPPRPGGRFALLYSGLSDRHHVNDMEFLYRCLVEDYDFEPDDIIVLNFDGTLDYNGPPHPVVAWPGDGTPYRMPVHGKGNRADLDGALDELAQRLGPDDLLLLHSNNHGYSDQGDAYICAHDGPLVFASHFCGKLADLPVFSSLIVMMEQCRAGGFIQPIIDTSPAHHTSVSVACGPLSSSMYGANFDYFACDWISAMHRAAPQGLSLATSPDLNSDGLITAREAHKYADSVHNSYDSPMYQSSSRSADECHLWGGTLYEPPDDDSRRRI